MSELSASQSQTPAPPPHGPDKEPARMFPVLAILGILGFLCMGPTLSPDGHLSYAYLRSLFFDGDLNIVNEAAREDAGWPAGLSLEPDRDTGLPAAPASAGPALFWAPFLSAAHLVAVVLRMLGFPILPDGYDQLYFLAINIGTFFYLLLGFALTVVALQRLSGRTPQLLLVCAVTLASPLLTGSLVDGSLPDAISFFGAAFFLFEWAEYRQNPQIRNAIILGISGGILFLIRPIHVVLWPWPIIDTPRQGHDSRWYPYWRCLFYGVAIAVAMTPQLLVWNAQYGQLWPPQQDRPEFDFHPKGQIEYLFSWPGGLFVNYPLLALGVTGLIAFILKNRRLGCTLAACFLVSLLTPGTIVAHWFPRQEAARFAVSVLPFAAFGASHLLGGRWKISAPAAFVLLVLLVLWSLFCDLVKGSFLVSSTIPPTALMIPKLFFAHAATFGTVEAFAALFLAAGICGAFLIANRTYRDIAVPTPDFLFARPGRRIGIWAAVIVSADLVVSVANWPHHQILLPARVGQHAFRVIPYTFNRFAQFKQVNLNLDVGPGATRTVYLSPPHAVSGMYLVTRVSSTRDIPWGTSVARFTVGQGDRAESVVLNFGRDTFGDNYEDAKKQFQGTAAVLEWRDREGRIVAACSCRLDLSRPVIAENLAIENLAADATVAVYGFGFRPSAIRVVPLERLRSRPGR